MIRLIRSAALLVVVSLPAAFPAAAQTAKPEARGFAELALTPDGSTLAWIGPRTAADPVGLNLGATAGGAAKRIATAGSPRGLAWSPDGGRLAFLATAANGRPALYAAARATGAVRQVAQLRGNVARLRWSPDGRKIAFLNTENPTRPSGPLAPQARDTGLIGLKFDIQRIAVVDVESGALHQISRPDLYVHEFEWSPDGSRFAATATPGQGDTGWYSCEIWIMPADGSVPRSLGAPGMQIASPVWSPDGTRIAYLGGLLSDEVAPGGDVYLIDAAGGRATNLTPGIKVSPDWLAWRGKQIVFTAWADGGSAIGTVDPATGTSEGQWQGGESIAALGDAWIGSLALAADGRTSALIRQSYDHPPEIWTGPVGNWTQRTHVNDGLTPSWGQAVSLHWKSDTLSIQGWLIPPRKLDAGLHPMVVVVHGGPAAAHMPRWFTSGNATEQALLDRGYFIFEPNPRGSQGFGQAFTRANVKDFGYGDLRDILAGLDEAARRAPIDTARVGITGWSYGGYMTMWAVTQTPRFKTAVAGAGLANWQSYWAQNGINEWLLGYFGSTVYDDPAVYARSAPMTFIKNAKTPTLILVGEKDVETPTPQSYEFWKGLQANGVETEFMVYADEGHRMTNPAHVRDRVERSVRWFDRHLRPGATP